jgi:hypothetical protein
MEVVMARLRSRTSVLTAGLIALTMFAPTSVATQEQFQFVVSARDADGHPITDLKPGEIVMLENGVANRIVKVEPFRMPVRVTIGVDNGILSRNSLVHYRTSLDGLVKALPPEIEVSLLAMAPQPRYIVPSTLDRGRIQRGIDSVAPEDATPRFADTIVEFSKRLQDEFNKVKRFDSLPVLVLISTTSSENSSYRAQQISTALGFLEARKTRVYVTMTTTMAGPGTNQGEQPMLAIPLTKATRGRYEALANTSRLTTLLPEFGTEIAALHQQRYNQLLVTAQRQQGLTGQLQNPRIELTRPNVTGEVSLDGLP